MNHLALGSLMLPGDSGDSGDGTRTTLTNRGVAAKGLGVACLFTQRHWIACACLATVAGWCAQGKLTTGPVFTGMSGASAAAWIDADRFVVANDEESRLRVYSSRHGGAPVAHFDFWSFLGLKGLGSETDLEGGARVGDRIYWIGSHNSGKGGAAVFDRSCLFATSVRVEGDRVELSPVGRPYRRLREDLVADPRLSDLNWGLAGRAPGAGGGLDIEGLAEGPMGSLWIGLRSPLRGGRALLIPLLNPTEVVEGERAKLGEAVSVDLEGLGIRDIVQGKGSYLILAGPSEEKGKFKVFRWQGQGHEPKQVSKLKLQDLHPEAAVLFGGDVPGRWLLLSDDGRWDEGGRKGGAERRFRSAWMENQPVEESH